MSRLRVLLTKRAEHFKAQSGYWRSLPNRGLTKLLLAVFFMFSTVGLVGHIQLIAATGRSHWLRALFPTVLAGLGAAAFVFAFIRDKRLFLIVVPFQLGWIWMVAEGAGNSLLRPLAPEHVEVQIALYGGLCTMTLLIGYVFFIDFITTEGVKHMGLRAEMALAERTHRSLVPPLELRTGGLEVYGRSSPSSQVGGDLLDAIDHEGRTLLYVADVSGHGVAAGTLMSLTKGAIRARLLAGVPLSALVRDLNRVLCDLSASNMFVTFAGIRFDQPGKAEVCLAGHLPILHFRGGRIPAVHLPNQSVPLGILSDAEFEATTVPYGSGDVLAILTDGLTEVEHGDGEELGVAGVERLIGAHLGRPLREVHEAVTTEVARHGPQLDDRTLLLVRTL